MLKIDTHAHYLPRDWPDLAAKYPAGAHPIVRGEAVNTGTTYGYDAMGRRTTSSPMKQATMGLLDGLARSGDRPELNRWFSPVE